MKPTTCVAALVLAATIGVAAPSSATPPAAAPSSANAPEPTPNVVPPPRDAVLAHAATVTLFVDDEDKAADELTAIAEAEDGYLASRDPARITLSVPSARFAAVWARVLTQGVVAEKTLASHDTAATLQSLRASLTARSAMLDQYLAALHGATSREDLAQFQSETTELVLAIEGLKGRLRLAEHAAAFAAIDVSFQLRSRVRVQPKSESRFAWLRGLGLDQLSERTRETSWHF